MQLRISSNLKKERSTIIYLPEFIKTLKGGFKDGSFEKKLHRVVSSISMLDDIGAELLDGLLGNWTFATLSNGS